MACMLIVNVEAQTPINHEYHKLFDENVGSKSNFVQRSAFSDELLSLYTFNAIEGMEFDLGLGQENEIFTCDSTGGHIVLRTHNEQTLETNQIVSIRTSFFGIATTPLRYCGELILADVTLLSDEFVVTDDNVLIQNTQENHQLNCLVKISTEGNYIEHREIRHNQGSLHRTLRYPQLHHQGLITGPFDGNIEVYDFAFKDTIAVIRDQVSTEYNQPEFSLFTEVYDVSGDSLHIGLIEGNGAMRWHGSITINDMVLRLISLSGTIDLDPRESENWYFTPENEQHLLLAGYTTQGELSWTKLLASVYSGNNNTGNFDAQLLNVGDQVLIDHWFGQLSSLPDFTGTISVFAGSDIADEDTLQLSGLYSKSARYATVMNPELNEVTAVYSARENGVEGGYVNTPRPTIWPIDNEHFVFHENFFLYQNIDWVIERLFPDQYLYQSATPAGTQHQVNYHIIPVNSLTGHESYVLNFNADPSDSWTIMMNPAKGSNGDIFFSGVISGYVNFEFPDQEPVLVMADFGSWDGIFMKCSKLTTSVSETTTSFSVFPNPAKDHIFVNSTNTEKLYFNLFSVDGKLISNGELMSGSSIQVSDLVPGIYLLRLEQQANSAETVRFVKY